MAKSSKINHNNKRKALVERYRAQRTELRTASKNMKLSDDERADARRKLAELPRNSAQVRVRLRCALTGRPRGNLRKFELSRMKFRELALRGLLPGVTKSSW